MQPHEAALYAAQAAQSAAVETRDAVRALLELAQLRDRPAHWERLRFTQGQPVIEWRGMVDAPTRSFGIYNPGPVAIYAGIGSGSPTLTAGAVSFPATSLVVLPIAVEAVELGIDPADQSQLAAGDLIAFGLRFPTRESAYMEVL